jgi:hypothetical protein
MAQVLTSLRFVLRQMTVVEILDAEGRHVSVDLAVPRTAPRIYALPETIVLPLLITPVPDGGVIGEHMGSWTRRTPMPGVPGVTLTSESTPNRCEEIGEDQLIVIRSEATATVEGPIDLAMSWSGEPVGNVGNRVPHRLQRSEISWIQESHQSLNRGWRALARGQIDQTYHLVRDLPPSLPAPRITDIHGRLHLETTAEIADEP